MTRWRQCNVLHSPNVKRASKSQGVGTRRVSSSNECALLAGGEKVLKCLDPVLDKDDGGLVAGIGVDHLFQHKKPLAVGGCRCR